MRATHVRATAAAAAAAALLSCDAPSRAVSPADGRAEIGVAVTTSRDVGEAGALVAVVDDLYAGSDLQDAAVGLAAAVAREPDACPSAWQLYALTLHTFGKTVADTDVDKGVLFGVQQVVTLLHGACAPVPATTDAFGLAELSTNFAAAFVYPGRTNDVETPDGHAGVRVPVGAIPATHERVLLTIARRLTTSPAEGETVLGTSLASGPFYELGTYPRVTFQVPVVVGLVQVGPYEAPKNTDVIVGHLPSGGETEVLRPQTCPLPWRIAGRLTVVPAYLRPYGGSASSVRASRVAGAGSVAAIADSSGTAGGCGSAQGFSPFGFIEVYRPGFNAKPYLRASHECGTRFRIENAYGKDLVAIWSAIPGGARKVGQTTPIPVLVRANGAVRVDVEDAGELRLNYGPVFLQSVPVPGNPSAC